ncbi:MAG: flagellar basal body P-ring formation chaperone FlgA [Pseudomonadota bacterium]
MMIRSLFCTVIALTALTMPATAATIIQTDAPVVRLGDIFHNIGSKADVIISDSPQPGQDMVMGTRHLLRLAKAHGVAWKPGTGDDTIILRRTAQSINVTQQETALKEALKSKGLEGDFGLAFPKPLSDLNIASSDATAITVDNLQYQPQSKQFSATLVAGAKQVKVQGHIVQLISVPVLKSPVQKGQVISAQDIGFIEMKAEDIKNSLVTNPDSVIGMVATKTLESNKPLRLNDINAQRLVERGQEIMIIYSTGPIQLTAKGKAMQNGQEDDVVQVVNLGSNLTLDARVTGNGVVTVY